MSSVRTVDQAQLSPQQSEKEAISGILWGGMVIGLLVLQIGMSVGAAIFALNSGSNDIVPDYYQDAVRYDETHSQTPVSAIKE